MNMFKLGEALAKLGADNVNPLPKLNGMQIAHAPLGPGVGAAGGLGAAVRSGVGAIGAGAIGAGAIGAGAALGTTALKAGVNTVRSGMNTLMGRPTVQPQPVPETSRVPETFRVPGSLNEKAFYHDVPTSILNGANEPEPEPTVQPQPNNRYNEIARRQPLLTQALPRNEPEPASQEIQHSPSNFVNQALRSAPPMLNQKLPAPAPAEKEGAVNMFKLGEALAKQGADTGPSQGFARTVVPGMFPASHLESPTSPVDPQHGINIRELMRTTGEAAHAKINSPGYVPPYTDPSSPLYPEHVRRLNALETARADAHAGINVLNRQYSTKLPNPVAAPAPQGLDKYLQAPKLQDVNTGISGVPNVGKAPDLATYGDQTPGTNYLPYILGAGGIGLGGLLGNYLGSSKKRNPRTGEMEDEGSTLGTLGGAALGGLGGYMLGQ